MTSPGSSLNSWLVKNNTSRFICEVLARYSNIPPTISSTPSIPFRKMLISKALCRIFWYLRFVSICSSLRRITRFGHVHGFAPRWRMLFCQIFAPRKITAAKGYERPPEGPEHHRSSVSPAPYSPSPDGSQAPPRCKRSRPTRPPADDRASFPVELELRC